MNQCRIIWICGSGSADALSRTRFYQLCKYHDIEVDDDVTAYVEYDSGATGVFITTTGSFPEAIAWR